MIRPTKYLDLNTCVLRIAAFILRELESSKSLPVYELDQIVRNNLGESAKYNFLASLNFLFLVGKITYDETKDSITQKNLYKAVHP